MRQFDPPDNAWQDAWCWHKVLPLLKHAGHTALAPDLPGHGLDHTPLAEITFRAAVHCVRQLVEAVPEPIILVGHGFAGMIISRVAECCPEKIAHLIYLAALLPSDGETATNLVRGDPLSELKTFLEVHEQKEVVRVQMHAAPSLFYHDCPVLDVGTALLHLSAQPMEPLELLKTPVTLSHRFASVPRCAIICLQDHVLSPAMQVAMAVMAPCEKVGFLLSGHSPFFSVADKLGNLLLRINDPDPWCSSAALFNLAKP